MAEESCLFANGDPCSLAPAPACLFARRLHAAIDLHLPPLFDRTPLRVSLLTPSTGNTLPLPPPLHIGA